MTGVHLTTGQLRQQQLVPVGGVEQRRQRHEGTVPVLLADAVRLPRGGTPVALARAAGTVQPSRPARRERRCGAVMGFRPASGLERLVVVGATWCLSAGGLALVGPWPMAVLGGWDIAAAVLVAWVWFSIGRLDATETSEVATREDNSRVASSLFLLSASVSSLAGAGLILDRARDVSGGSKAVYLATAAASVVLSWTVVQTMFALRYAHEYYTAPIGGIDFGDGDPPAYQDFAYVSFTVGMTFQVSDTAVQSSRIRRTVLRHALLAYVFGAVILAVTVNVIASILG